MQDTIRITIHQNGCMFKDMVDQEVAHLETGTPAVESNMRQLVLVALMEAMDMIAFMLQHLRAPGTILRVVLWQEVDKRQQRVNLGQELCILAVEAEDTMVMADQAYKHQEEPEAEGMGQHAATIGMPVTVPLEQAAAEVDVLREKLMVMQETAVPATSSSHGKEGERYDST